MIAGFAAIYLIWGSTYLGIRIAVESMPAFLMAGTRFLLAGLIVALFIAFTRGFKATAKQWRDNAIIGGFLCLGGNGLVSWAEEKVPSGIATLIISAGPVFIVLMDWGVHAWAKDGQRGTRPNGLTLAGVDLVFIGLAILVGPDVMSSGVGGLVPWRLLALLGETFLWVVGMMILRYTREAAEPFEDDGGNEPLELARRIEAHLDALSQPASAGEGQIGEFVIALLIAAGYVTQEKVEEARKIALSHGPYEMAAPTPPAAEDALATKAHLAMCDAGDSVKYYYYADPNDENCEAQELCMAVGFSDNNGAKIYFHLTSKCGCAAMLTSPDSGKEGV